MSQQYMFEDLPTTIESNERKTKRKSKYDDDKSFGKGVTEIMQLTQYDDPMSRLTYRKQAGVIADLFHGHMFKAVKRLQPEDVDFATWYKTTGKAIMSEMIAEWHEVFSWVDIYCNVNPSEAPSNDVIETNVKEWKRKIGDFNWKKII